MDRERTQEDSHDDAKVVKIIREALEKDYEKPKILQSYNELIPITENKFYEAFIESAPQLLLQLYIHFGSRCSLDIITAVTILTSFLNLAATVTDFSLTFRQKIQHYVNLH